MVDQQFFKELDEYLRKRPKIKKPVRPKLFGAKYNVIGAVPTGVISPNEQQINVAKAVQYINDRKEDFQKRGSYFYDNYVLPAARKLDENEFTVNGKRIIRDLGKGKIELKGDTFGKYADIDPRRISAWKSGAENISKENMLKLVIALKMDLDTACKFLREGGFPFNTNDDQNAIIQFTISYSDKHGVEFSVEDYMQILKEGHKYGNYRGIYDKLRYKAYYNKAYESVSEYTREVTVEMKSVFRKRRKKPDTEALKLSGKDLNQMLIKNYIQEFIDKKNDERDRIDKKLERFKPPLDLKKNFSEYAIIGPSAWENILYLDKKPEKPTMLKLAIAMEMLEDDARTFLDETDESLKITEPLDFVIICAMEYEQENNCTFSPECFWNILERCKSNHEFNYKIPYRDYE